MQAIGLQIIIDNQPETINIDVRPVLRTGDTAKGFILVVFEPSANQSDQKQVLIASDEPVARHLEEELIGLKAQLRSLNEQHEFQAEELKASNEELQAMNEELRSAAEELETSKEELQSINEELRTVNQELKVKIEETSIASNNLQNLINSTDIGTIFLDRGFRVALFTPAARNIFNLIPADYGRPLTDITHRLEHDGLLADAETVLAKLTTIEKEVRTKEGRDFLMRLTPYRTDEDRIKGVVITFVDITERKKADEAMRISEEKYRTLFNTIDEGFCIIEVLFNNDDRPYDYRFLEANKSFELQTGLINASGKTMKDLAPEHEQYWFDIYGRIAKTGEPARFENEARALHHYYEVYAFRTGKPGENKVAILFNDISERRQREQHQQFLINFSDAIRAEPDADAIANRAIQLLAEYLQLDRCYVGIALLADNRGIFPYQFGNDRVAPMPESVSLSDFSEALRKTFDKTLVITDFKNTEGLTETEKQNFAALGFGALVVANVRKEMRNPYWSINAISATPRRWTNTEIHLIEDVTERTWAAVERAKAEDALKKSEDKYRTIFNSIDEGFAIQELMTDENGNVTDLIYREVNEAFEKHTGMKNAAGKKVSEFVPHLEQHWLDALTQVYKTGKPLRSEDYTADLNRWITYQYLRIGGPDSRFIAAVFNDITERKNREAEKEFIQKLSDALRSIGEPLAIEETVTRMAMDHFAADRCYYGTIEGEAAVIRRDARQEDLPSVAGTYPLSSFTIFKKAVDEGRPLVVDDAHTTDVLDEELKNICIQLQVISFINIPVIKNNEAVGNFCLVQSTPRSWTEVEVRLAVETAERTWSAIERAKAEEALRASEETFAACY